MLGVALAAALVLMWWLTNKKTLFVVSVRRGRALLVSGRIPSGLFEDILDLVRRERIENATIRAIADEHRVRVVTRGLSEGLTQRLRNTCALYSIQTLRAAPMVRKPTLGQLLGVSWLAWLLAPPCD